MKNKWFMLFILYLAGTAVSLGQLKLVPIAGQVEQFPLLMSVFTLAGVVLAVPGGAILGKLGPKKLLLGLMCALVAGNVLGAAAGNAFPLLFVSRIVEGVSFAMIIMVGLVMINAWFADGGVSTATGIFTTFAAIGSFVANNIGLPVTRALGARGMWWVVAAVGAVAFALVALFVTVPAPSSGAGSGAAPSVSEAAKNSRMWILALSHMFIAFLLFGYINTYPALFGQVYSVGEATANFYNSLNGIFGIPACIIGGVLVSKTGKPYLIALIGGVGAIATCALNLALGAGPAAYVLHAGISALFIGGFALTANLCIAPRLARTPSLIGYTMSFVNMLYYVGIFACPLLILGLAGDGSGWGAATVLMAAVAAAAVALMAFLTFSRKKSAA